jgi:hypothetical protein
MLKPKKTGRLENSFYDGLVRGANKERWWLHRTESSPGLLIPFDIQGSTPAGIAVGLECKRVESLTDSTKIPWSEFSIPQQAWLEKYAMVGAFALVALCCPGDKETEPVVVLIHLRSFADFKLPLLHQRCTFLKRVPEVKGAPEHWINWSYLQYNR